MVSSVKKVLAAKQLPGLEALHGAWNSKSQFIMTCDLPSPRQDFWTSATLYTAINDLTANSFQLPLAEPSSLHEKLPYLMASYLDSAAFLADQSVLELGVDAFGKWGPYLDDGVVVKYIGKSLDTVTVGRLLLLATLTNCDVHLLSELSPHTPEAYQRAGWLRHVEKAEFMPGISCHVVTAKPRA